MSVPWKGWAVFCDGAKNSEPYLFRSERRAKAERRAWKSMGVTCRIVKVVLVEDKQ